MEDRAAIGCGVPSANVEWRRVKDNGILRVQEVYIERCPDTRQYHEGILLLTRIESDLGVSFPIPDCAILVHQLVDT